MIIFNWICRKFQSFATILALFIVCRMHALAPLLGFKYPYKVFYDINFASTLKIECVRISLFCCIYVINLLLC